MSNTPTAVEVAPAQRGRCLMFCSHNLDPRTCSVCLWYDERRPRVITDKPKHRPPNAIDGAVKRRLTPEAWRANVPMVPYAETAAVRLSHSRIVVGEVSDVRPRIREGPSSSVS